MPGCFRRIVVRCIFNFELFLNSADGLNKLSKPGSEHCSSFRQPDRHGAATTSTRREHHIGAAFHARAEHQRVCRWVVLAGGIRPAKLQQLAAGGGSSRFSRSAGVQGSCTPKGLTRLPPLSEGDGHGLCTDGHCECAAGYFDTTAAQNRSGVRLADVRLPPWAASAGATGASRR